METNRPKQPTYEVLPIEPEKNPPENIEELEALIAKLQDKALSIKQQLDVVQIREKQGLPVDYDKMKRALYARAKTNKSISELQRIRKRRMHEQSMNSSMPFERLFFEASKEILTTDVFAKITERTYEKLRQTGQQAVN